ncbi:glycosyltransferase family 1 protein [Alkalibacterium putridalgicola]|uniref:glycosyltransferase family 1 protein n=1 Tax=Alkalibacterium putridalgicola TaxID=426703 RepID=UPI0034CE8213
MNVLTISTTNLQLDGISNVIINYYTSMDKSDMKIDFVFPKINHPQFEEIIKANNSNIYTLNMRKKNPFTYVLKLTKLIKENKYDIIHAHGNSSTLALEMLASKMAGIEIRISHCHSTQTNIKHLRSLFNRMFKSSYNVGLACSKKAGEYLYEDQSFEVINNGIDIDKFQYDESARRYQREPLGLTNEKLIGHIGHFSYSKNHDFLIDVFQKLYEKDNNYRLLLIGDGKYKQDIEEKVSRLNLSEAVIFAGKRQDIPELLSAIDLFVMPSRFEGLPVTLIEAQAAHLPCYISDNITTEVKVTELVHFVPLDDNPEEWARCIDAEQVKDRISADNKYNSEIIKAGFSIKENASHLKQLYTDLLAET